VLIVTADYKDFASKYSTSGSDNRQSKSPEGVAELMERLRLWLTDSPTAVINIQTVDHHAYYRSAMDAPGLLFCILVCRTAACRHTIAPISCTRQN